MLSAGTYAGTHNTVFRFRPSLPPWLYCGRGFWRAMLPFRAIFEYGRRSIREQGFLQGTRTAGIRG